MRQSIFTIIAKVDVLRVKELEAYLATIDDALMRQSALPFTKIDMLHFCSLTVFKDDHFGPYLVFESNVDGTPHAYLDTICAVAAPALHAIYSFCPDYAPSATVDPAYLRRYLQEHIVSPGAAFVGNLGRSAQRVRDEAALVAAIGDFLDRYAAPEGTAPETVFAAARDFVKGDARWDWVWRVPPRLSAYDRLSRWLVAVALTAVLFVDLPLTLLLIVAFLVVLRRHELTDPVDIPGPPVEQVQQLTAREDQIVQNHMASLCYLKPGAFRRGTLKLVLFLANVVARVSTNGTLSGLNSLHFAHWSLIDDDARLLFLTNYDGSWENYLDDFIDKAAIGLTAIWSNTLNFPRTSFLVFGGARDERKFKAIARTTQAYTNVWYSAYPALPVTAIQNNTAICDALSKPVDAASAAMWLQRF